MSDHPGLTLRPSLRIYFLGFVAVTALLSSVFLIGSGEKKVDEIELAALEVIAERRAAAASNVFGRALWQDWRDVKTIAKRIGDRDADARRAMFDLIVGVGSRVSWAGYAVVDGTVINASGGKLEGTSVADRIWFQRGLNGPFAGDIHEAKLLANVLRTNGNAPMRFLDLAAPVATKEGFVTGVIGFQINARWANDYLQETSEFVGVEAMLVGRDGLIVVGPDGMIGEELDLASIGAARTGSAGAFLETWPDGKESLTVVLPSVAYRDLPSFGWSFVARLDQSVLDEARASAGRSLLSEIATLFVCLLVLALLFARYFISPFTRVAEDAERIAKGEDIYPTEFRRTSEMARLGAAVSTLQSKLQRPK